MFVFELSNPLKSPPRRNPKADTVTQSDKHGGCGVTIGATTMVTAQAWRPKKGYQNHGRCGSAPGERDLVVAVQVVATLAADMPN